MQGTVSNIWHNQRADGSEYWVVSIDGQRYSVWEKSTIDGVREGDAVEFAFTNSGRYRKLTAIKSTKSSTASHEDGLQSSSESLQTVKMNCLRAAAAMIKDAAISPEQKVSLAIGMARGLEDHILRRSGSEKAQSPTAKNDQDISDPKTTGRGEHDQ